MQFLYGGIGGVPGDLWGGVSHDHLGVVHRRYGPPHFVNPGRVAAFTAEWRIRPHGFPDEFPLAELRMGTDSEASAGRVAPFSGRLPVPGPPNRNLGRMNFRQRPRGGSPYGGRFGGLCRPGGGTFGRTAGAPRQSRLPDLEYRAGATVEARHPSTVGPASTTSRGTDARRPRRAPVKCSGAG